jgi:dihydrofolate synthase/folylpolyglutamate synthase
LAIKVCEILSPQIKLTKENIRIGLLNTIWPGRMEEIEPGVFLDGAHNLDGIKALLQGSSFKRKEKSILLFSVVREKNYKQMISALAKSGKFSEICITSIPGTRGVDMVDLANEFRKYVLDSDVNIVIKEEIKEAYQYCKDRRSKDEMGNSQKLYVIGSLYLIGAIKELKLKNGNN